MSDEPKFPSPGEVKAKRASTAFSSVPTQPARPVVVVRPDPPADGDAPSDKGRVKLTPDEVRALLAVSDANRPSTARSLWRRGRIVILPTGLIQLAAHLLLGGVASHVVMVAVAVGAIMWTARPLFKKDGWD